MTALYISEQIMPINSKSDGDSFNNDINFVLLTLTVVIISSVWFKTAGSMQKLI